MKIISQKESRQILRNLYKKEAPAKYAQLLHGADSKERRTLLAKIDKEVEDRIRHQVIAGD